MIRRRLHLQIYATIIASLLAVVVVLAVIFGLIRGVDEDMQDRFIGLTERLAWMALPDADSPQAKQREAVKMLGDELGIDINLFDKNWQRVATYGEAIGQPEDDEDESGWHGHETGSAWYIKLQDDRWLAINLNLDRKRRPIIGLLLVISGIAGAIGLASYPFVRRLTGRLERLKTGVAKVGDGDLSTRVTVEGKDEIANLAESFNDSAAKIERLVNSNKQLLANASHELRTPLARVRLGVEMLKENPDAKRQKALENDIGELDQLIDEILLMSRLDTDAKPQMQETIDLLALCAEEASRYEDCSVDGDVYEIHGNSKLVRRAIRNLIDNGFKHGAPPVQLTLSSSQQNVTLTVSDAGKGIDAAEQDKVFQPFYRSPGKQNVEGYGLGLALVRQIVEAHGGQIMIAEEARKGTTFIITLPIVG